MPEDVDEHEGRPLVRGQGRPVRARRRGAARPGRRRRSASGDRAGVRRRAAPRARSSRSGSAASAGRRRSRRNRSRQALTTMRCSQVVTRGVAAERRGAAVRLDQRVLQRVGGVLAVADGCAARGPRAGPGGGVTSTANASGSPLDVRGEQLARRCAGRSAPAWPVIGRGACRRRGASQPGEPPAARPVAAAPSSSACRPRRRTRPESRPAPTSSPERATAERVERRAGRPRAPGAGVHSRLPMRGAASSRARRPSAVGPARGEARVEQRAEPARRRRGPARRRRSRSRTARPQDGVDGQAEHGDVGSGARDHDVRRVEGEVRKPLGVRGGDDVGDLADERERRRRGRAGPSAQDGREVAPVGPRGDDVDVAGRRRCRRRARGRPGGRRRTRWSGRRRGPRSVRGCACGDEADRDRTVEDLVVAAPERDVRRRRRARRSSRYRPATRRPGLWRPPARD